MRMRFTFMALAFALVPACLWGAASGDFFWHFPFDELGAAIQDVGPQQLKGRYIPSDAADNDNGRTTDPDRYRLPGKQGKALFFFPELGSSADIEGFRLKEPAEQLHVQFYIKAQPTRMAAVVGCKWDSGKDGFILFVSQGQWRFYYGDGKETHRVIFKGSALNPSQWIPVSATFDHGTVTLTENGKVLGVQKTGATAIAPNKAPLVIGNFQRGLRRAYPFGGGLDEVCIADTPETARQHVGRLKSVKRPEVEMSFEPIDGNEVHFGHQKVLHTFPEYPVSATFRLRSTLDEMRGRMQKSISTGLVMTVPAGVTIVEAFVQSWTPRRVLPLTSRGVTVDGKPYVEYRLPADETGNILVRKGFGREELTLVFKAAKSVKRGRIYWQSNFTEPSFFDLKVLPVPRFEPLPQGQFSVMGYISADERLYGNREDLEKVASLFAQAGFLGTGRSQVTLPVRAAAERHLQDRFGLELFEISLWSGPQKRRTLKEVPAAVTSEGNVDETQYCPYAMTQSKALFDDYVASCRKTVSATGTRAVILDYEPWGEPGRICYCGDCLKRFQARFKVPEKDLTPAVIARKYRKEWGLFWTETTYAMDEFLVRAAKALVPDAQVWDYTYVFDYDDPKFEERFWEIPKDPRKLEALLDNSMLSLYHVHGDKLIDQVDVSRKHLKKEISGIILLTRSNLSQGRYTSPQESLSPRQIRQKLVLLGALGMKTAGLYPGTYIDYAFIPEIGRAVRQVRERETFYFQGKRVDREFSVRKPARCIAWEREGKILLTVFNFSGKDEEFEIQRSGKAVRTVRIAGWDVAFIQVDKED